MDIQTRLTKVIKRKNKKRVFKSRAHFDWAKKISAASMPIKAKCEMILNTNRAEVGTMK